MQHPHFAVSIVILTASAAFCDPINGRIVERQTRKPIASAEVRIHKPGAPILLADLDTDRTGQFHGPDLAPGDYIVEVSKPNFIPSTLHVHAGGSITLSLVRYGVIAGRVIDAQAQPVAGARLTTLVTQPGGGFTRLGKDFAMTDAHGLFRLFGLPPARYVVALSYDGSTSGSNLQLFPNDSQPQIFNITGGEEIRDINFTLVPRPLYHVAGTLVAPPAPSGFGVTLTARDRPYVSIALIQPQKDGKFQFDGVPAGSYELIGVGPVRGYGYRSVSVEPGAKFGRIAIEVAGQNIEGISIPLEQGRTASFVLRPGAGVCRGGTIQLSALEDMGIFEPPPVTAAMNQPVSIADIPPGRYNVEFVSPTHDCYQTAPATVDLTAGSKEIPLEITIDAAGSLTGKLTGTTSPADYELSLIQLADRTSAAATVIPDSNARFTFPDLVPGRYRLSVISALSSQSGTSVDLTVTAGRPLTMDISAPSAIEGLKP